MASALTDMQADIIGKDKEQVADLLGLPKITRYWKNAMAPEGATPQEIADFEADHLDEIWVYPNGKVHFTMAGKAKRVDNDVSKDFPPNEEPPLVA